MLKKVAIIIPSRLASTRLANKPLVDIAGKSMIERVYLQAKKVEGVEVFIALDGQEIASEAKRIGAQYVITDPNLPSGTDRINAAIQIINKNFDLIVNLQGDLPNISPDIIKEAIKTALENDADIVTLACKIKDLQEISNPNIVKIAISFDKKFGVDCGKALYFSRSAIPYSKNFEQEYFHHIGLYVYKSSSLKKFVNLEPSPLEKRESLEQLRALESNMSILVKIVNENPLSVDTAEDLEKVKELFINNGN